VIKLRRSSAVEQLTFNQLLVGSIPTAGANNNKDLAGLAASFFCGYLLTSPRLARDFTASSFILTQRKGYARFTY
jgi:hypothetical protein